MKLCVCYPVIIVSMMATASATLLGFSTSAYQVEGGYDERGLSIWDTFASIPGRIADGSDGKIACDHYHKWEEDLDLLSWMGTGAYRFSLSWPRILPDGRNPSDVGISFYNRLIDGLVTRNITPIATLSHWDIPQVLQDEYGGWEGDGIVGDFTAYAKTCYGLFGDRVRYWITLNEPLTVAQLGYGSGAHAPGIAEPTYKPYEVAHRMLLAHAGAYHAYHNGFAARQGGRVSIALNSDFVQARDPSNPGDKGAAERALLWRMGWFADPIFFGDYPQDMRQRCGSRLPSFHESDSVRGTMDFFSLNHYTTLEATPSYNDDYNLFSDPQVAYSFPYDSTPSASPWLRAYPAGMYGMIRWIHERYNLTSMSLVISESGVSTFPGQLDDTSRIGYIKGYTSEAFRARDDFGIGLLAYCLWSILDNFEWAAGYSERYGLVDVDFDSLDRTRTPKDSARWIRNLFAGPDT